MSSSLLTAVPDRRPYDGIIGRRLLAFVVDMMLMACLGWFMAGMILIFGVLTFGFGFLMFHILPWLPLLYLAGWLGTAGATPGQLLFGLALRRDGSLLPPGPAEGFVWALLFMVSFALGGLPFLLALLGPKHRAGHDLLSGLAITRRSWQPRY